GQGVGGAVEAFFFSSQRRHTNSLRDWSSDVCSSDLRAQGDRSVRRRQRYLLGCAAAVDVGDRDRVPVRRREHLCRVLVQRLVGQIGRASCRERVEISVVAGVVKDKKVQAYTAGTGVV